MVPLEPQRRVKAQEKSSWQLLNLLQVHRAVDHRDRAQVRPDGEALVEFSIGTDRDATSDLGVTCSLVHQHGQKVPASCSIIARHQATTLGQEKPKAAWNQI